MDEFCTAKDVFYSYYYESQRTLVDYTDAFKAVYNPIGAAVIGVLFYFFFMGLLTITSGRTFFGDILRFTSVLKTGATNVKTVITQNLSPVTLDEPPVYLIFASIIISAVVYLLLFEGSDNVAAFLVAYFGVLTYMKNSDLMLDSRVGAVYIGLLYAFFFILSHMIIKNFESDVLLASYNTFYMLTLILFALGLFVLLGGNTYQTAYNIDIIRSKYAEFKAVFIRENDVIGKSIFSEMDIRKLFNIHVKPVLFKENTILSRKDLIQMGTKLMRDELKTGKPAAILLKLPKPKTETKIPTKTVPELVDKPMPLKKETEEPAPQIKTEPVDGQIKSEVKIEEGAENVKIKRGRGRPRGPPKPPKEKRAVGRPKIYSRNIDEYIGPDVQKRRPGRPPKKEYLGGLYL